MHEQHLGAEQEGDHVHEVRHAEDGDEQVLGIFQQLLELDRRRLAGLGPMPQADAVDGKDARLDAGEHARDEEARRDGNEDHHGASSSGAQSGRSMSTSRMRLREVRRMTRRTRLMVSRSRAWAGGRDD
ncbi:MAG: hypothetical protein QM796_06460 [Chthoniobacteraceae bacterium]